MMKKILLSLIEFYQKNISLHTSRSCRYHPTCSHYAKQVIHERGAILGSFLAIQRIARCHPFHPGGWDPVEE
jgi:putative membrane protein insertion efficiency factor